MTLKEKRILIYVLNKQFNKINDEHSVKNLIYDEYIIKKDDKYELTEKGREKSIKIVKTL